ncbi:MAG TPA: hypothetical protein VJ872_17505 [Nocardioides sp.]|nr:hypothetical protein [Nocardioides sp.]
MISTLISLPYELTRRPIVAVGDGLTHRLREDATPRVFVDWAIGSADRLAGILLRDPAIARRGVDRIDRSAGLAEAARLERKADGKRDAARATQEAWRAKAQDQREAAQETVARGLDEADAVEAHTKHDARVAATNAATAKKAAADREASRKRSAARERRERAAEVAAAKEKVAQHHATAELEEARRDEAAAAEARKDADRLEELTDAKKAERRHS